MKQQNLIDAVTSDIHFIQAGFRAGDKRFLDIAFLPPK
jgi:hypothetical protein